VLFPFIARHFVDGKNELWRDAAGRSGQCRSTALRAMPILRLSRARRKMRCDELVIRSKHGRLSVRFSIRCRRRIIARLPA